LVSGVNSELTSGVASTKYVVLPSLSMVMRPAVGTPAPFTAVVAPCPIVPAIKLATNTLRVKFRLVPSRAAQQLTAACRTAASPAPASALPSRSPRLPTTVTLT
jgi:hypothetical protein